MGYKIHIIRKNNWEDFEEESDITLADWLTHIPLDEELILMDGYKHVFGGKEHITHSPGFCEWDGHPTLKEGNRPWFDYGYGSISTKNPDDHTIRKMLQIADALEARVQGDDGEFYDEDYFSTGQPKFLPTESNHAATEIVSAPVLASPKKKWWKFW